MSCPSKPIPSPHKRSVITINGERLLNGRKLAETAHRWMEANRDSFFLIYEFVRDMQSDGRGGRVRDRVAAYCVDHGIEIGADPYAFNNNYWAGISRYLVLHDDTLADAPIKFRDSDIDCYGLLPVSYLPGLGGEK